MNRAGWPHHQQVVIPIGDMERLGEDLGRRALKDLEPLDPQRARWAAVTPGPHSQHRPTAAARLSQGPRQRAGAIRHIAHANHDAADLVHNSRVVSGEALRKGPRAPSSKDFGPGRAIVTAGAVRVLWLYLYPRPASTLGV